MLCVLKWASFWIRGQGFGGGYVEKCSRPKRGRTERQSKLPLELFDDLCILNHVVGVLAWLTEPLNFFKATSLYVGNVLCHADV
jgi:hypothetical protein